MIQVWSLLYNDNDIQEMCHPLVLITLTFTGPRTENLDLGLTIIYNYACFDSVPASVQASQQVLDLLGEYLENRDSMCLVCSYEFSVFVYYSGFQGYVTRRRMESLCQRIFFYSPFVFNELSCIT